MERQLNDSHQRLVNADNTINELNAIKTDMQLKHEDYIKYKHEYENEKYRRLVLMVKYIKYLSHVFLFFVSKEKNVKISLMMLKKNIKNKNRSLKKCRMKIHSYSMSLLMLKISCRGFGPSLIRLQIE